MSDIKGSAARGSSRGCNRLAKERLDGPHVAQQNVRFGGGCSGRRCVRSLGHSGPVLARRRKRSGRRCDELPASPLLVLLRPPRLPLQRRERLARVHPRPRPPLPSRPRHLQSRPRLPARRPPNRRSPRPRRRSLPAKLGAAPALAAPKSSIHTMSIQGVGLGLRSALVDDILGRRPSELAWLEVAPENYMRRGGRFPKTLAACAEQLPIVTHGLTLSLGGTSAFSPSTFRRSALSCAKLALRGQRSPLFRIGRRYRAARIALSAAVEP